MVNLIQKISQHDPDKPFFTFEFFPPRTDQGFENLTTRISRLAQLQPLAISITWGAGGSTKDRSLVLAGMTQIDHQIDTILHLTCTNMVRGTIDDTLRDAKSRGIKNILALRGDPPRGEEYWIATDPRFSHAIDLVSYVKSSPEFSSDFCIGVAAYPDGHPEHVKLVNEDEEIENLKTKVDAGADFIITQLFYDVDRFLSWLKKVRARGITIPILPGVMPIQTYASFVRLTKLTGARIPPELSAALEPIRHDDQLVKDFGVSLAVTMIRRLVTEGGLPGAHFCTLNLEKSVQRVLEDLNWAKIDPPSHNALIADSADYAESPTPHTNGAADADLVVQPVGSVTAAAAQLSNFPGASASEVGRGELNQAASWDDFPNGRFGDFKSPAYGDQDPWGNATVFVTPEQCVQWGTPKTLQDLTSIFLRYLHSELPSSPFSPFPLSPESAMILPHLERLTKQGLWTVGSQPAVDGVSSTDPVVGWGPKNGYVFQKCFVEFFTGEEVVRTLESKSREEGGGWVQFFACNEEGELRTNVPEEGRNAVTWGIFSGREVAQSTIIERESFLSWKDEAFSTWAQWASFFRPGTPERTLLDSVRKERWLVSVVHHDYKHPDALWNFLFEGQALS